MSDSAKAEISEKIQDVCRYLFIKERQSEPKYQHQNPCERRWQNIKHNTTHMMNRFFVPAFCWLLALNYVVYVMNHTAVESLQWRTPIEVLTGQTPDISPILQYRFFEDVYYRNYYAPNTIGGDNERAAWFVGFAENVGHSMTYRVLSKETMELLSVSSLRRAAEGRNLRADDRARLALLGRGLDLNGMKLQQDADGNYVSLDNPEFAFVPSTVENDGRPPPILDPASLIGRTFLFPETEDGSRDRATITGWVDPPIGNELLDHPDVMLLRCKVKRGDTSWEDLVAYNEVLRLLEKNLEHEGIWTFEEIVAHEGPLHSKHKNYRGSQWNVQVKWSTGEVTWEPICNIIKDDPVYLAIYAKKHGLLDTDGWKSLKPYVKNEKKTLRILHQSQLKSYRRAPIYKYGYQVPRNHNEAMQLDAENGNTKWRDAEILELGQIDEYEAFEDRGVNTKVPEGYKKIRVHMVYDIKHDGRHKARLVADGHLTDVPLESVYSSVVSLRAIRLVTFLAELNALELWGTDIGNAYLESYTKEKVCITAGDEFGERKGHLLIIRKALYGLRSSGARWHDRFHDVLREMGWTPCKMEPDVWMKRVDDHYEYIATYVDDLMIASKNPKAITDELMDRFHFKLKGTGPLTFHLGCDYFRDEDGTLCVSPKSYIERFLSSFKRLFGHDPNRRYRSPLEPNDHPEIDTSEELDMENTVIYQSLIGGFQWAVSLGRIDMAVSVGTMSSFRAAPRQGHLDRVKRMCGYLFAKKSAAIRIRTEKPDYSSISVPTFDWERIYGDVKEIIPDDIPEPLGKSVVTTMYLDANLLHCLATGRSVSGILHFLNKTPVDWFSKKQNTVETATYGSEFTVARIAVDQQIDIRLTLRYMGVPLDGKAWAFGDNESVVTSSTVPHSKLGKRHNALNYHRVREAIAAKIVAFVHIPGKLNIADVLSKHWMHATVWPMLQALLFWPGDTAELLDEDFAADQTMD
jgi:hypothetical protein